MYRAFVKRWLDILLSFIGLVFLSVPMLIVAVLIKLDSPGPVLFRQKRLGRDGKEFEILKFRSMCVGAEQMGSGVYSGKADFRVTRVGKILRATSIDEFPQLLNVLLGDMSLVGPRPPLTYHPWPLEQYTDEQRHMFDARPGLTGWAQVHGRKNLEWHKRIELNIWYSEHLSFWLDIRILFLTMWKVLTNADNESVGTTVNAVNDSSEKEMVEK